jgi:hypothetical protein
MIYTSWKNEWKNKLKKESYRDLKKWQFIGDD